MAGRALGLPAGIEAVLFDLDGVLTDTASVHRAAWREMFDEFLHARDGEGYRPFTAEDYLTYVDGKPRQAGTRDFLHSRGIDLPEGTPDDPPTALTVAGLSARKNALVQERIHRDGVDVFVGSVHYLRAVRAAGLRTALVSASENAGAVVDDAGLGDLLDARVDGHYLREHHLRGKPAPDTYLAGARLLGVEPSVATVVEDAIAGVTAGRAGRFGYVVGVDRAGQADALRAAGADVVVGDLSDLLARR